MKGGTVKMIVLRITLGVLAAAGLVTFFIGFDELWLGPLSEELHWWSGVGFGVYLLSAFAFISTLDTDETPADVTQPHPDFSDTAG